MNRKEQVEKAKRLLELHQAPQLLVLPNVWDPLGARLLQGLGYPAVATASASVAYSLGYDDGQRISWDAMVEAVQIVSEAKAAALQDLAILSGVSKQIATGTGTDAIAIVSGEGPVEVAYCGKHTLFGEMLAKLTIEAISASIEERPSIYQKPEPPRTGEAVMRRHLYSRKNGVCWCRNL